MNGASELYDAILARRSVRRYEKRTVPIETLDAIRDYASHIEPLEPATPFSYSVLPVAQGDEITAAMGGYGKLVSAPHVIVPFIKDGPNALADFGFRIQQLVIYLTQLGLGSCWVGALTRKAALFAKYSVPAGMTTGAIIAFGYESRSRPGRLANRVLRGAIGASRKKPLEKFVWTGRFGEAAALTGFQTEVLEALRASPSTGNAQPWCAVLLGGVLYFSVREDARYYRLTDNVGYHLVDAGIGMADISLALRALGHPANWTLLDNTADARARLALPGSVRLIGSIPLSAG
jgi:nitroreductase